MVHHLYHLDVDFMSTVCPIQKGNDKDEGLQGWKGTHVPLLGKIEFYLIFPRIMFDVFSNFQQGEYSP